MSIGCSILRTPFRIRKCSRQKQQRLCRRRLVSKNIFGRIGIEDESDEKMLSGSLKERLAQYKTLKEEEQKIAASPASPDLPVPSEAATPDPDVVNTTTEESLAEEAPKESTNVEEYEEEESVENQSEENDEEEKIDIEASSSNGDDDASSEEDDDEEEASQRESEQDQDVFKALDEAERADNALSSSKLAKEAVPAKEVAPAKESIPAKEEAPTDTKPKLVAKSRDTGSKKCDGMKWVWGIFLASAIIVAIVLPFVLDPSVKSEPSVTMKPETASPTVSPTDARTAAPTSLQWVELLDTFLVPISGEEVFKDENSPQYRAAKYILDDPYTALITTPERLSDRYASATFYFATEGENWNSCYFGDADCDGEQWLVDDVCDWYAVSCDDDGRVASYLFANAEGNGLIGTLPIEMKLLTAMTDLVIVNNTITGTLPEAFGEDAMSLRSLLLPDNELTGNIPGNYLGTSPLEFVHLGNNGFSGPIPTSIGNNAYLRQLDLSGNSMTGTISAEIGGYEVLEALSLANNELQGNIPNEIYDLTNLKFLHMNGNALTGTISSSVGDLSSLKELRVGGSGLSGHIPDELYSLTNLVELDISQALFDGRFSLGILNLEDLEKLIVSDNKLVGTVPFILGQLSKLSNLSLQGNGFSGSIPESVCLLREENLEVLTADCEKITCDCCSSCF